MDGSRAHEREVAVDEGVHTQPATIEIMAGRLGHNPLRVCSSETVVFFRIFRWLIHAAAPIIAFEQWPYNPESCGAVQVAGAPPVWRGFPNLGRGRPPRAPGANDRPDGRGLPPRARLHFADQGARGGGRHHTGGRIRRRTRIPVQRNRDSRRNGHLSENVNRETKRAMTRSQPTSTGPSGQPNTSSLKSFGVPDRERMVNSVK